jgi:hypothetical protein
MEKTPNQESVYKKKKNQKAHYGNGFSRQVYWVQRRDLAIYVLNYIMFDMIRLKDI